MFSILTFGIFWKFLGFFKIDKALWNFLDGLCENGFKSSCIALHLHYDNVSYILNVCLPCWNDCMLVGLDWATPMMYFLLHITCSCIFMHMYLTFSIFIYIDCDWCFLVCLSLSLSFSLLLSISCSMAPKQNLLHLGTLFVLGHPFLILPPLIFNFMMIKPNRTFRWTFLDETFIWNAKSFCQTSPTLTYPLSFTVSVGSHYVTSKSLCDVSVTCPFVIIQEFYSNIDRFDYSAPLFVTSTHIVVTADLYPRCSTSLR